jgi:hypothetical protein
MNTVSIIVIHFILVFLHIYQTPKFHVIVINDNHAVSEATLWMAAAGATTLWMAAAGATTLWMAIKFIYQMVNIHNLH